MDSQTCCPPFNVEAWDDRILRFDHLHFIKRSVVCLWYIPLNFAQVVRRAKRTIEAQTAEIVDGIVLSDHRSLWRMDALIAIDRACEGLGTFTLEGEYLSAVYEGPHGKTAEFAKDFTSLAQRRGVTIKRYLMYYPLCPRCAKEQGKNYSVMIAQIE